MTSREPGKHPYARAYEKATGKRAERVFVPPFRAPADDDPSSGPDPKGDPQEHEDPDQPRVKQDARAPGYGISRAALVLVALALGVGLLIGRVSVNTDQGQVAEPSSATTTTQAAVPLGPKTLQETGARCSQQKSGNNLVLGVEVRNFSTGPVTLQQLRVTLPPSGLTLAAVGVGSCGEIDVPNLKDFGLSTQGTVWLSTTVHVTRACPASLPVSMTIYASDSTGRVQPIAITGFKNLKSVPWSGCTTASAKPTSTPSKSAKSSKSAPSKSAKKSG